MDTVGGVVASGKRRYAGCPLGGAKLIRHDFPCSYFEYTCWVKYVLVTELPWDEVGTCASLPNSRQP